MDTSFVSFAFFYHGDLDDGAPWFANMAEREASIIAGSADELNYVSIL